MLRLGMAITLEPGTIVADRYRLDRLLGEGGMGVVWAATHAVTRRTVAMKFVRNTLGQEAELRRRLLREAHAAAAVRHPHVVEILDVFELDSDTPVIVMALLHGETLGQHLARVQHLALDDAAAVLLPAVSAIGTAHARGIVHRDLKPDNIYLAEAPEGNSVKVLDFGIAKLQDPEHVAHDSMSTQTGSTLGTPAYMAPEQAAGEQDVDHLADIWALGVIAYECLSGVRPIEGENAAQVVMRLMTTGITPLARVTRGLPVEVTSLVDRMLSRERARRPQDLREVQRVFAQYTDATVPDFGPPRSELATNFERVSQRPSTPPHAASFAPPEPQLATLVMAASPSAAPHESTRTGRKGLNRLTMLGLAGAAVAALLTWRVVGRSGQPGPAVVTDMHAAVPSVPSSFVAAAEPGERPIEGLSASSLAAGNAAAIARLPERTTPAPPSPPKPKAIAQTIPKTQTMTTDDVHSPEPAPKPEGSAQPAASAAAAPKVVPRRPGGGLVETPPF